MDSPSSPGLRRIVSSALILAAILALSILTEQPPSPKPADAPAAEFSAVRALDALHRVLGKDLPHPVGSPADDDVRARIIDELKKLGYEPDVQTGFACSGLGVCAAANNVVAPLDGTDSSEAVLLAAHYDSVPAGPGDSDDGSGVATILEIARALKSMPAPRHSIILLLDEGEEAGLLGARAFVDSNPLAKQVRAVVNLDARGTSGPSLLFETGSANAWVIRLFAQHASRPETTSAAYALYKLLPNDTDFTVFKAAGYQGLNFAFLGQVALYHTPLDNAANVHIESLQHQGENALPSILALANADLSAPPPGDAVFFSLGRWVIHWPERRSLPFACSVFVMLLAEIGWMVRTKRLTSYQLLWGIFAWIVAMTVTGALALMVFRLIAIFGGLSVTWLAYPLPLETAFWCLAISVVLTNAWFFARRAAFQGLWTGVWTWWCLLAILASWQMPGLSYIFLIPAATAALAGVPLTLGRSEDRVGLGLAAILPVGAAAILAFPLLIVLYTVLGNIALLAIAVGVGLTMTPLMPLAMDLSGRGGLRFLAIPWIPIVATGLALFAGIVAPAFSAKSPERVNISYWQDSDSGVSQWIVEPRSGRLSEPLRLAATFKRAPRGALPWDSQVAYLTDAPHLDMPSPTFTILESSLGDGRRNYRALLRSERGVPLTAAFFPPDSDVDSVRVNDQSLPQESVSVRNALYNGWAAYVCPATPSTGVEISFSLPIGKPVMVSAADEAYGLPPQGAFLLHARPLTATPSQNGDVSIITRRIQLLP